MARRRATPSAPQLDPQQMRAWRAVRAFKALVPQLQNYVRAVTGNPTLRVEATAGAPRTDGKVVYLTPPARLGDDLPHDRRYCHRRDPKTLRQICKACDVDDVIDAGLHHELAHILFGTLEEPTPAGLAAINALIKEWHPADACDHAKQIREQIEKFKAEGKNSYILYCNLFDSVLGILLNAFEDARVNVLMFDHKPGTRASLTAHAASLMSGDTEDDPDWVPWHERDVNSQLLIGMFLVASEEFNYVDLLDPTVKEVLWSDEIDRALVLVGKSSTVHDTVQVTVDIFRMLQDMGIMVLRKCTPKPPEEDGDASTDEDGRDSGSPDPNSEAGKEGGDNQPSQGDTLPLPGDGEDPGELEENPGPHGSEPDRSENDGSAGGSSRGSGDETQDPVSSDPNGEDEQDELDPQSGGGGAGQGGRGDEDDPGEADGADANSGEGADPSAEVVERSDAASPGDRPEEADDQGTDDADGDDTGRGDADEGSGDQEDGSGTSGSEPWVDDADSSEGELDEASREALRSLAGRMTLHKVFAEQLPEADRNDFASGDAGHLLPVAEGSEGGDDSDSDEDEDEDILVPTWSDPDKNGNIPELLIAIAQSGWFEEPSAEVLGVQEFRFPAREVSWVDDWTQFSRPETYLPGEEIIGGVTTVGRIAFDENRRWKSERNLKSGRINTRALARRAPFDDERLFKKTTIPGKKSYKVVITLDFSGSTSWGNRSYIVAEKGKRRIDRIKRAAFAQAEALSRLSVPFEMWAHSADYLDFDKPELGSHMQMLHIKTEHELWDDEARKRLACVNPWSGNLDGHTLEFARKRAEQSNATDRIIIYYTDGAMPAMNAEEEGNLLLRETEHCRKNRIHLFAVGINTRSPEEWGFDTVEVRSDEDLVKVMEQLLRALTG